jgi:hypothetical protein
MNFSIGAPLYEPAMNKIRIICNSPGIVVLHDSERKAENRFSRLCQALSGVPEGGSV